MGKIWGRGGLPRLKDIDAGVDEEYSLRFDDAPFGRQGYAYGAGPSFSSHIMNELFAI